MAKDEKFVILSLRLINAAIILVPLVAYYIYSRSPQNFLNLELEFKMPNFRFNIISYNLSDQGTGGYVLSLRLSNTGSVTFGLKRLEGVFLLPKEGISGMFSLENPIEFMSGREGNIQVNLLPKVGNLSSLVNALSGDSVVSISGDATLTVNEAELPLTFSVDLRLSDVMVYGEI